MKKLVILIILIALALITTGETYATSNSSGSSAALLKLTSIKSTDNRVKILSEFLKLYHSPLSTYASDFVKSADDFDLDWKLVAAISGVESTFGQQIPFNSYNGWGWGIYGDNIIRFSSWENGIETVSRGLRENYLNKWGATDVYEIGRFYAASPTWASKVDYFMQKITQFQYQNLSNNLSISL